LGNALQDLPGSAAMISLRNPLKALMAVRIPHEDVVIEWKLNAFYKLVCLGLIPILTPLLILFAYYRAWGVLILASMAMGFLALSCYLAYRKELRLSVCLTMAGSTLSTFGYLQLTRTPDGLYFVAIMILIAGIFLGVRDAFIWAGVNSALLIYQGWFLQGYSVFPYPLRGIFDPSGRHGNEVYLSTIIFLYLASAVLSILFQQYFSDLLTRIKESQQHKLLLESELMQAQKLEIMGILAGGIAHEFSHSLTRIKSCTSLIQKWVAGGRTEIGDVHTYAESIHAACHWVHEMSSKLLSFARKKGAEMGYMNVHDLIESVLSIIPFISTKDVSMETRLEASRPTIFGNFTQLQSVLLNLIINSFDAIRTSGSVKIATRQDGNFVVISIIDDGIGIDDQDKPRIFTPLYTSKPQDKGTGLGLPLAAYLIKLHKGTIGFQSEKGVGTTFWISIPAAQLPGLAT
jgi:signal transduction histidine kinase